jgi:hypothetical protein
LIRCLNIRSGSPIWSLHERCFVEPKPVKQLPLISLLPPDHRRLSCRLFGGVKLMIPTDHLLRRIDVFTCPLLGTKDLSPVTQQALRRNWRIF